MGYKRRNFISKEHFESKITKTIVPWNNLVGTIYRLDKLDKNEAVLSDSQGTVVNINLPDSILGQIPEVKQDFIIYLRPKDNDVEIVKEIRIFCEHCNSEFSAQRNLNVHKKKCT